MTTYEIDPQYMAQIERTLAYLDIMTQAQAAAFAASHSYQQGLEVLHILQAQCRTYAAAFAELLACWQARTPAQDNAFEAGVAYGRLLESVQRSRTDAGGA